MVYYNEFEPYPAVWLYNLMKQGTLPKGRVDCKDFRFVYPKDLENFNQCHFFAGIGAWPYALELAGRPREREFWTGSCPCQPFSVAGKGEGEEDRRHVWP